VKNFQLVRAKVDVEAILAELFGQPEAWYVDTNRQRKIHVQQESESIPIRSALKSDNDVRERDVHESCYARLAPRFPAVVAFLEEFAEAEEGALGRAKIVRLCPGKQVLPHRDIGAYYGRHDRYHLILQSEGSWMRSGNEEVVMRQGQLWWFDNKQKHEARNESATQDRIHLIFDLDPRPWFYRQAEEGAQALP
jgi:hypothetical protein